MCVMGRCGCGGEREERVGMGEQSRGNWPGFARILIGQGKQFGEKKASF